MRPSLRLLCAPLAVAAVAALPACSSSKPAQAPASTTVQTRGDADVMAAGPNRAEAPRRQAGPGGPGSFDPNMTPEERTDQRLAQLDAALTLSAEQKTRLRPILLADLQNAPRMRREDLQNMDRDAMMQMRAQMQERRERLNRAIEAELTPAQVARYREMEQEMRGRMRQGRPNGGR